MSYKKYIHSCKEHDNKKVESREKICPECGQQGTFNGWGQSVIEMMASYQRRYNLRALGPHRKMTDELFHGRMIKCDVCNGYGLVDSPDDDWGKFCPKCDYGQLVFDGTPEEFEGIRQKIIAEFPYADPAVEMPPQTESPKPTRISKDPEGGGFFKPAGDSLQAYKEFVMTLYRAINPDSEKDSSMMSDEEWEDSYKKARMRSKNKTKL